MSVFSLSPLYLESSHFHSHFSNYWNPPHLPLCGSGLRWRQVSSLGKHLVMWQRCGWPTRLGRPFGPCGMGKQQSIDANLPTKRNFDQHFFFIFFRCGMCPTLPTFQNEEGWEVPRYSVPFADSRVSQPNLPPKKHSGFTTIAMAKLPANLRRYLPWDFFGGFSMAHRWPTTWSTWLNPQAVMALMPRRPWRGHIPWTWKIPRVDGVARDMPSTSCSDARGRLPGRRKCQKITKTWFFLVKCGRLLSEFHPYFPRFSCWLVNCVWTRFVLRVVGVERW